jgi:hypothetical protein
MICTDESVAGRGTGIWHCPLCGYVDPKTKATRCPRDNEHGRLGRPLFVEIIYGQTVPIFVGRRDA